VSVETAPQGTAGSAALRAQCSLEARMPTSEGTLPWVVRRLGTMEELVVERDKSVQQAAGACRAATVEDRRGALEQAAVELVEEPVACRRVAMSLAQWQTELCRYA
jgi:hypothetical protein